MSGSGVAPDVKLSLEKGALGKAIFVGESAENIKGSGTCANCGATFAQSDIYSGKYDCQEKVVELR